MITLHEGRPFKFDDHTPEEWAEYNRAIAAGERCEVTSDMADYWLDVLPPRLWRRRVVLADGTSVVADFGFAEGESRITAHWSESACGVRRYYAQLTRLLNRG